MDSGAGVTERERRYCSQAHFLLKLWGGDRSWVRMKMRRVDVQTPVVLRISHQPLTNRVNHR